MLPDHRLARDPPWQNVHNTKPNFGRLNGVDNNIILPNSAALSSALVRGVAHSLMLEPALSTSHVTDVGLMHLVISSEDANLPPHHHRREALETESEH